LSENIKIHSAENLDKKILSNPLIKTVVITTQSDTHYNLIKQSILAGKNVFVEKPITLDSEEAKELTGLAKKLNKSLVIGYEFMFDPNIKKLKKIIESGEIGEVKEIKLNMLNPLGGRVLDKSTNVIEDLGSHMFSILHELFNKKEVRNLKSKMKGEEAELNFKYNNMNVCINVDRDYHNERSRNIIVNGTKLKIVLDYEKGEFFVYDLGGNEIKENKIILEVLKPNNSGTSLESEFEDFFNNLKTNTLCNNDASSLLWISFVIADAVKLAICHFSDTEEEIFEFYQKKIREGLDINENNYIKGTIHGPENEDILELPEKNSDKYNELLIKGKKSSFAFGFSAGGLTTRSNEVMSGGFSFVIPELSSDPKSFMEIKFSVAKKALDNLRKETNNSNQDFFIVIMDSYNTHKIVMNVLKENNYFGFNKEDVFIYTQGIQKRIIPSDEFLEKYREDKKIFLQNKIEIGEVDKNKAEEILVSLDKGIELQKGKTGQELKLNEGSIVFNPAGHWDFIKWLVLSGTLAKLKRKRVDFLFHSNLNNPAAKPDDILKGFFINEIEKFSRDRLPIPVSLIEVAENRGERGGIIAKVKSETGTKTQIIEEPAMKKFNNIDDGFKHKYPYFNTNTYLIYIPELMKKLGLKEDYDKTMNFKEIADLMNNLKVPVYISVKEKQDILEDDTNVILVGLQLERYSGALTQLWPWIPVKINRDEEFIPIKKFEDITQNKLNLLSSALKEVSF
jgi:predicted dehydrogenase